MGTVLAISDIEVTVIFFWTGVIILVVLGREVLVHFCWGSGIQEGICFQITVYWDGRGSDVLAENFIWIVISVAILLTPVNVWIWTGTIIGRIGVVKGAGVVLFRIEVVVCCLIGIFIKVKVDSKVYKNILDKDDFKSIVEVRDYKNMGFSSFYNDCEIVLGYLNWFSKCLSD